MTQEEQVVQRYFDLFNRHDLEGVMTCFHEHPAIVDVEGKRIEGREAVRAHYAAGFAVFPDGRCDLKTATGSNGHALAESTFLGTRSDGKQVVALGAEVVDIVEGKIKEIRDYHRRRLDKAA